MSRKGLSRFLVIQLVGGQLPQLGVDQREQLLGRLPVARAGRVEDPRHLRVPGVRRARVVESKPVMSCPLRTNQVNYVGWPAGR